MLSRIPSKELCALALLCVALCSCQRHHKVNVAVGDDPAWISNDRTREIGEQFITNRYPNARIVEERGAGQFFAYRFSTNDNLLPLTAIVNRKTGKARFEPLGKRDLRFDEKVAPEPTKSNDLPTDIKRMWKTIPNGDFPVSPVSAINAASRVFETVPLIGKNTNEVFALIGHNKTSSDSGYNFPFFPVERGTVAYRFDCGNFGWQFNLVLDSSGTVQKVERKWIH